MTKTPPACECYNVNNTNPTPISINYTDCIDRDVVLTVPALTVSANFCTKGFKPPTPPFRVTYNKVGTCTGGFCNSTPTPTPTKTKTPTPTKK
jgi:hypothetical protein